MGLERISIPESYRNPTHRPQAIMTESRDEWTEAGIRPKSDCAVCKGAGVIHPRDGGAVLYSKIIYCTAIGCLFDSLKGIIPAESQRQTFETFRPVAGNQDALKYAKQLAYGESKFVWLLIYGQTGNGKTHLCNAVISVMRERGFDVRMILSADFFAMLKESMKTNQTDQILRKFEDVFFLAIDDYGVEYGSDWESSKFDELMTSRFATAKATLLITNKDITQLPDRIRSRFSDAKMARVAFNAAGDYRGKK